MRRVTTAGMRARAYEQQRRDAERSMNFTAAVMGFGGDPQAVADANARLVPAFLGTGGVYGRDCLRGTDRAYPVRCDAEPETRCAGCGRPIADHAAVRS